MSSCYAVLIIRYSLSCRIQQGAGVIRCCTGVKTIHIGGFPHALHLAFAFALLALPALALELDAPFDSIDGGDLRVSDWRGQPVLLVNTASRCGFTYQYDGLQELYDRYRDRGLVVLAVPSNDFRQELSSEEEVKEFCEVNFGLDIPMTTITPVRGSQAHPLYASLAARPDSRRRGTSTRC